MKNLIVIDWFMLGLLVLRLNKKQNNNNKSLNKSPRVK